MFWADFLKSLDVAQRVISIETLMEVSLCTYCILSPPGSVPHQAAGSQEHRLLEEGSSCASCLLKQLHGIRHLGTNCKFLFLLQQIVQKSFFNPVSVLPQFSAIRPHWPSTLQLWILAETALHVYPFFSCLCMQKNQFYLHFSEN